MKDYRLTLKVRNNRILKAIESVGGTPGNNWCAANGLTYSDVNNLINMTISPLTAEGDLRHNASILCDVLGKIPSDLWSNEQLYPLEKNFSEMEMDYAQVVALLPDGEQSYLPDFSEFEQAQTKALVSKAIATLSPREKNVIHMRFDEEVSLIDCGKRLGVTQERVRQIEAKALRKLRSPLVAATLIDALDFNASYHTKKPIEEISDVSEA